MLKSKSGGKDVLFEFVVTNPPSEEKTSSGLPIVEVRIDDEESALALSAPRFDANAANVTLHNFPSLNAPRSRCGGSCEKQIRLFLIYPSGKSVLISEPPRGTGRKMRLKVLHGRFLGPASPDEGDERHIYRREVRRAFFVDRVPFRNCFVCRCHRGDSVQAAVFCSVLRRPCNTNEAVGCEHFQPITSLDECERIDQENADAERRTQTRHIVDRMLGRGRWLR